MFVDFRIYGTLKLRLAIGSYRHFTSVTTCKQVQLAKSFYKELLIFSI